jgi:soluble lytic murein transglycosylase-like protein
MTGVAGDLAAVERRIDALAGSSPRAAQSARFERLVTGEIGRTIARAAAAAHVDSRLVAAVAKSESNFDPAAVSASGAIGVMQLMPATAQALGVTNPYDPAQNVRGGASYLRELLERFHGDVRRAVAAYNAGPGAVERYGGVPPYAETQAYVARVLADYYRGDRR